MTTTTDSAPVEQPCIEPTPVDQLKAELHQRAATTPFGLGMRVATRIAIFDLDGTLADDRHRSHHLDPSLPEDEKDWDAYHEACGDDPVIEGVARLAELLHKAGLGIHLLSGRWESNRARTEAWCEGRIGYDALWLRPNDNDENNPTFKRRAVERLIAAGYEPVLVVDDHPRVATALEGIVPVVTVRGFRDWSGNHGPTRA